MAPKTKCAHCEKVFVKLYLNFCTCGGRCAHECGFDEDKKCRRCRELLTSQTNAQIAHATVLPIAPEQNVFRIRCIGHGTYCLTDRKFICPANVSIRFQVPHGASTRGGNDLEIREQEDVVLDRDLRERGSGWCYNYRLWSLTGSEHISLSKNQTKEAHEFMHGWSCLAGQDTFVYVKQPGDSVELVDLVRGLGGFVSQGRGLKWEVIWQACREILTTNDELADKQRGELSCITLE